MWSSIEAVIVENLVKRFKDVVAVNGVNFKIVRGEIFSLLGPNGVGKTTTIHIIATILKPTLGRVLVFGHDVVREAFAQFNPLNYPVHSVRYWLTRANVGLEYMNPTIDITVLTVVAIVLITVAGWAFNNATVED